MKRIILGIAVVTAMVMSSCTKESEVVSTAQDAISFGTYLDVTTKGKVITAGYTNNTNVGLKTTGFGVLGYYTSTITMAEEAARQEAGTSNSNGADYFYNQEVYFDNENWTYYPVKYWSNRDQDYFSFFAYAPYNGEGLAVSDANYKGYPYIDVTIADSPEDMVDFVATQVIDAKQADGEVKFTLGHRMTRLQFSATTSADFDDSIGTDQTYVIITGVKFSGDIYKTARYTFGSASVDYTAAAEQLGTWDFTDAVTVSGYDCASILNSGVVDADVINSTFSGVTVAPNTETEQIITPLFLDNEYLFLIPNGTEGLAADGDCKVTITYRILTYDANLGNGYALTNGKDQTISFPAGTLAQGKAYNCLLNVGLESIDMSVSVSTWTTAEASPETTI